MTRRLLAAALLLGALAPAAHASEFWERVVADAPVEEATPDEREALIAQAGELGVAAARLQYEAAVTRLQQGSPSMYRLLRAEMREAAERAVGLLERALAIDPDDADVHFALAEYYFEFLFDYYEDDLPMAGKRNEMGEAAIEHWNRFEELAPRDPRRVNFIGNRPEQLAFLNANSAMSPISGRTNMIRPSYQFKRSIVYTKLGGEDNWAKSIDDYEYCLALAPADAAPAKWTAQLLTNSAEILMGLGRLDEAIERYRESLEYDGDPLYLYGLAVAYDRKGLAARATDAILEALAIEGSNPMDALDRTTVFFIPDGDIHYYKALVFEARGETKLALLHYREFLRVVKDTKYGEQAQRHIDALTNRRSGKQR